MARKIQVIITENNLLQQELDKRARRLERLYSELDDKPKPFDWDTFNQENPAQTPSSRTAGIMAKASIFALVGAAIPLLAVGADVAIATATGGTPIFGAVGAGTLTTYSIAAAAVGGTTGGMAGALNDPKPHIHQAQLEKWKNHLDEFEKKHQPAFEAYQKKQEIEMAQEQQQDAEAKVWQDRVENTISVASEILPL